MSRLVSMKRRLVGWKEANSSYEKLDLRSMQAPQTEWLNVVFDGCNMALSEFRGSRFVSCVFRECDLRMVNFLACTFDDVRFVLCEGDNASFQGAQFSKTIFQGGRFTYSNMENAILWEGTEFARVNLHGADLTFLDAKSPSFTDCSLWGVKVAFGCPFYNSKFDRRTCQFFLAMLARCWPAGNDKEDLAEIAGDRMKAVERLMGGPDGK